MFHLLILIPREDGVCLEIMCQDMEVTSEVDKEQEEYLKNFMEKEIKQKFNFNEAITTALDQAIIEFFQTYKKTLAAYAELVIHAPKVSVNVYQVRENYLNHFIQYGLELQDCGVHPDAVSMLLENAAGIFLERCEESERDSLRLQLLYVKKALHLLYADKESYVNFTAALASEKLDLSEFHKYFADILDERSNEVKYVYTSVSSVPDDEETMEHMRGCTNGLFEV